VKKRSAQLHVRSNRTPVELNTPTRGAGGEPESWETGLMTAEGFVRRDYGYGKCGRKWSVTQVLLKKSGPIQGKPTTSSTNGEGNKRWNTKARPIHAGVLILRKQKLSERTMLRRENAANKSPLRGSEA